MDYLFPAGKYYIGDPCYVVADEDWIPLLEGTNYLDQGLFEYKDKQCWASPTSYGDGVFNDNRGNEYGVDAGLIGILPVDACDEPSLLDSGMRGGQVIDFNKEFRVWEEDGVFHFGTLRIDTR